MANSTKSRNRGKVEYRRVQEEVESKLDDGFPALQIFDELTAAGRLTMSYSNFCFYVRGKGERKPGLKKQQKLNRTHRAVLRPPPRPVAGVANSKQFTHNNVADLDELGPPKKQ